MKPGLPSSRQATVPPPNQLRGYDSGSAVVEVSGEYVEPVAELVAAITDDARLDTMTRDGIQEGAAAAGAGFHR